MRVVMITTDSELGMLFTQYAQASIRRIPRGLYECGHRRVYPPRQSVPERWGSRVAQEAVDSLVQEHASAASIELVDVVLDETTVTEGGSTAGGEGGGDGSEDSGGGDDDPPNSRAVAGDEPERWKRPRHFLRLLIHLIRRCYSLIPDFVVTMRRFDDVFPDHIHRTKYRSGKHSLLRAICASAEWDQPMTRRVWRAFWWRVRFTWLVAGCFRDWIKTALPKLKWSTETPNDGGDSTPFS